MTILYFSESEKAAVCGLTSDIKPSSERQPLLLPSYNTEDKKVGDTIRVIPVYGDIYRDNTQTYPQATTIPPRDYLPISIFTAIFCCCTIGILAVYKSIRAREATQYGMLHINIYISYRLPT